MKGDPKVLVALQALLSLELSAIHQYMAHSRKVGNWGYDVFAKYIKERAVAEMGHAQALMDRLEFFDQTPNVTAMGAIVVAMDAAGTLSEDLKSEKQALEAYNAAVQICYDVGDSATRKILEEIASDEDGHANEIEAKLTQIAQMGIPQFLATQVDG